MSLAGPADPMLRQMLSIANGRGIMLIATVGDAGPTSPPLYPGADAGVIGVTATNAGRRLQRPRPGGNFRRCTGRQISGNLGEAAHVSGVAALLLATKPKLTPAQVRGNLVRSAHRVPGTRNEVGAGVVDALAVVNPGAKIVGVRFQDSRPIV